MNDHVLILGAGGFIGRHLVERISQQGNPIIAVSRSPIQFAQPNVETVIADLRAPEDFTPFIARCHTIVYLASTSTPGTSAGRPVQEIATNLQVMAGMLQVLQDYSEVQLLFFSSGGSLYTSPSEKSATETTVVLPRSYHGAGKLAAEHFIAAWCSQYSGRATILRPSNVYGPGQFERTGFGIVPTALGKIRRRESLEVWGDGSAIRDYLYIDDLAELVANIVTSPMRSGANVVNACSGIGVSLNELFAALEAATGMPLLRNYELARRVDASRIVMDPTFANEQYPFVPATPLHEGLGKTWNWLNTITH